MLIAMALTLILVYAIAEFYAYVGEAVKDGRASITMGGSLRTATHRLKTDLDLLTYPFPMHPWADDGRAPGYFEILEGPCSDFDANGNFLFDRDEDVDGIGGRDFAQNNVSTLLGDGDDILAFTIRSSGEPFVGRHYNGTDYDMVTSNLAEVIWFTGFTDSDGDDAWDPNEPRFLYRRQLLIRPDLSLSMPTSTFPEENIFHHNDISAHQSGASWVANSLADLTRRENRFAHQQGATNFPNPWELNPRNFTSLITWTLQDDFAGEDRLLSNLLAFDVRVFDPTAELRANDSTVSNANSTVQPGDVGWIQATSGTPYPIVGNGAYVDLYYNLYATGSSTFSGIPNSSSGFTTRGWYDTWALSYERDYLNQDYAADGVGDINTAPFDEGADGLDSNSPTGGVDDPTERETSPPYPVPLRGIQVKIRMYDPGTRQMRQGTVGADFIAE